ncbi:hypothetical protein FA15DRAFT_695614 [Coprinopsis marcescibilis]|uniref:Uncharacterized protein n=1 Tax=Coprinopsis marcescibilis TaxID=230819 RepID=A0A5C3KQ26_COPMA|nr:hypothetical protein FA15DRAFT_695614 [Coprinopsis marcescibilis]
MASGTLSDTIAFRLSTKDGQQIITQERNGAIESVSFIESASTIKTPQPLIEPVRLRLLECGEILPSDHEISILDGLKEELASKEVALLAEKEVIESEISSLLRKLALVHADLVHTSAQGTLVAKILSEVEQQKSNRPDMPAEILSEIFLWSILEGSTSKESSKQCPMPTPSSTVAEISSSPLLAITQVSSLWRTTAIGCPQLWNQINFQYAPNTDSTPLDIIAPKAKLLQLWLERSHPLAVHLSLLPRYSIFSSNPIHPSIVDAISSISNRIRSLEIDAPVKDVLKSILFPMEAYIGLPSLHSLRLCIVQRGIVGSPHRFITGFEGCQSLKRLSLDLEPPSPRSISVNWRQLTHLDTLNPKRPLPQLRWMDLIRLCPNLVAGSFLITSEPDLAPFDVQTPFTTLATPFYMSDLEELVIEYVGGGQLSSLVQGIHFKRLRRLEVYAEAGFQNLRRYMPLGDVEALSEQLRSVRLLSFSGVGAQPEDFMALLSNLVVLEDLKLDVSSGGGNYHRQLLARLDNWILFLPRLRNLVLGKYVPVASEDILTCLKVAERRSTSLAEHAVGISSGSPFHISLYLDSVRCSSITLPQEIISDLGEAYSSSSFSLRFVSSSSRF